MTDRQELASKIEEFETIILEAGMGNWPDRHELTQAERDLILAALRALPRDEGQRESGAGKSPDVTDPEAALKRAAELLGSEGVAVLSYGDMLKPAAETVNAEMLAALRSILELAGRTGPVDGLVALVAIERAAKAAIARAEATMGCPELGARLEANQIRDMNSEMLAALRLALNGCTLNAYVERVVKAVIARAEAAQASGEQQS